MKELIPENRNRLNRESRAALIELKQSPESTGLYCLQLAQWALDKSLTSGDSRLQESLYSMQGWKPRVVMTFLEQSGDPVPWSEIETPTDLAEAVLMTIHDNLTSLIPDYPQMSLQRLALNND